VGPTKQSMLQNLASKNIDSETKKVDPELLKI